MICYDSKFAMSLQYLKQEVRDGVHSLHADKHQSFHKLGSSFSMEVARHVQSMFRRIPNRNLVVFFHYNKKKVSQLLLCAILMQNSHYLQGSRHVFVTSFLMFLS